MSGMIFDQCHNPKFLPVRLRKTALLVLGGVHSVGSRMDRLMPRFEQKFRQAARQRIVRSRISN